MSLGALLARQREKADEEPKPTIHLDARFIESNIRIQTALQIILSELRLLVKHDQLSFHRSREYLLVVTELFPLPCEDLAHSPNLEFFHISTTISRSLNAAQHLACVFPFMNVSVNKRH